MGKFFEIEVTQLHGARFELAMERFKDGNTIMYQGATITISSNGYIVLCVESTWRMENATKKSVLEDALRGKQIMSDLRSLSPVFESIVNNLPIIINVIEDYGMGYIVICSVDDNKIEWHEQLR